MSSRYVSYFTILVILLAIGSIAYPGAVALSPYEETTPSYAVAHESTEAFDEFVDRYENSVDTSTATPVGDLSPETQRVFDEAVDPPETATADDRGGWQSLDVTVCRGSVHYCDEYEERPEFPTDVYPSHAEYGVVDYDGELYLTRTDYGGDGIHFEFVVELILKVSLFVPYSAFLAYTTFTRRFDNTERLAFGGIGLALVSLAVAFPYVLLFVDALRPSWLLTVTMGTAWTVIVGGVGLAAYRS